MEFVIGLAILAADIWAIVNIFGAPGVSAGAKLLWTLLILVLPLLGLVIWWFAGPRSPRRSAA